MAIPCEGDVDCPVGQICLPTGVCGVERTTGDDTDTAGSVTTGSDGSDGSSTGSTDVTGTTGSDDTETDGETPDGGDCDVNEDCRDESICRDGICTFIGECVAFYHCLRGQECVDGMCVGEPEPDGPPIPCEINQDCPKRDQFCYANFCRDGVECLEHAHCPPNLACFFRKCRDPWAPPP